jgi:probable F420-dependent oxidoreductase
VHLGPRRSGFAELRDAWVRAEALGVDTIFNWDHFFPLWDNHEGPHFECWMQLGALAEVTRRVQFGPLVTAAAFRNPNLLADMARTVDHASGGRFILGIGTGNFSKDADEYGFPFGTIGERMRRLESTLVTLRTRLDRLDPPPVNGSLPILIATGSPKTGLRLVAEHAAIWNHRGPPEELAAKGSLLDDWCHRVGRDPASIERSVLLLPRLGDPDPDTYLAAGCNHLIAAIHEPGYDLGPARELVEWRHALTKGG